MRMRLIGIPLLGWLFVMALCGCAGIVPQSTPLPSSPKPASSKVILYTYEGGLPLRETFSKMTYQEGSANPQVGDARVASDDAMWVFGYAAWRFYDDGTMEFEPPLHLRYDLQLYPLSGTWKSEGSDKYRFTATKTINLTDISVTMTIAGTVNLKSSVVEVIFTKQVDARTPPSQKDFEVHFSEDLTIPEVQ